MDSKIKARVYLRTVELYVSELEHYIFMHDPDVNLPSIWQKAADSAFTLESMMNELFASSLTVEDADELKSILEGWKPDESHPI